MLVLLLPIAAALVGGCAYMIVSMAPPRTRVGRWLALWIAVWAEVVLTAELLSLLDAVTPLGFLLCYFAVAALVGAAWSRRGKPRVRLLTMPQRGEIRQALRGHPALAVLLIVLCICALVNLVLALGLPVNNWDSLTYHLSRVGYWIQHGSTDHFFTHNERQNFAPPNAEFGMLGTIIFARAEWPAPLGQYAAYFVCMAAVYFIARQTGASNAASVFAALLLGTMTEVVLQATIPKNGLIVSSFLACAAALALAGLRAPPAAPEAITAGGAEGSKTGAKKGKKRKHRAKATAQADARLQALVWSALALGLAAGTKVTALLLLPGLAVAGVVVAAAGGAADRVRRTALWAGCCAAAVVVLGSLDYFRNLADYGSISGPEKTARLVRAVKVTPRAVGSNLARYAYYACDFSGLVPQRLARALTKARASVAPAVFESLGVTLNAPELNYMEDAKAFPVDEETGTFDAIPHLHEDTAWFGPIAFFLGAPLVLVHLVYAPLRRNWVRFTVALMPVAYWLAVCCVLRYQPWGGRFFVTAAVMGAPLLSVAYMPTPWRGLKHAVTWLLTVIGISTAATATFCNSSKPIWPKSASEEETQAGKEHSILNIRRLLVRCRYNPVAYTILSVPPVGLPERMRLGVVLDGNEWDWPLFGRGLGRQLIPLEPDSERVAEALRSGEVDMVVIRKTIGLTAMPPILGERPFVGPVNLMQEVNQLRANCWSFVYRNEAETDLFFPARDWFWLSPGALVFDADQQFIPTRVLPAGRVAFPVEPGPLVNEGPLVFEFYAGDEKVNEVTVMRREQQAMSMRWPGGARPKDQVLRVRVTSTEPAVAAKLRESVAVYRLLDAPRFEPTP